MRKRIRAMDLYVVYVNGMVYLCNDTENLFFSIISSYSREFASRFLYFISRKEV